MAVSSPTQRPLTVSTPLGTDDLLLVGFSGHEGLSQLFHFHLDLIAKTPTSVPFDKLLGQPIGVKLQLAGGKPRFFHGMCSRVSQGESDELYTDFRLEMVPRFWLWARRARSRIFQHKSVPEVLQAILQG